MPAIFLSLILASISLVASLGGGNEWDLTLCKERGIHWRNNQHNYLYSGLLGQVECPDKFSVFISTEECQGSQTAGVERGTKVLPDSVHGLDISGDSVGTQTAGPQDEGAGREVSLDQRTHL